MPRCSRWCLPFWLSKQNSICITLLPHAGYMPCLFHPSWHDHSNYTWRKVQVMKLLNIVTWRLKAEMAEPERKSIASQRFGKHVFVTTNHFHGYALAYIRSRAEKNESIR
jgi:hypothetical protein